ncbi:MAG: histidinol-phosphate transaminase [Thermoflexibacter sp.]
MEKVTRKNFLKQFAVFAAGITAAPEIFATPTGFVSNQRPELLDVTNRPIWLNANENPYGIPPKAQKAITEAMMNGNRYGFSTGERDKLKQKLAEMEGLSKEHILLTAGSSEVLGILGCYYGQDKGNMIFAFPTFWLLGEYAKKLGVEIVNIPLTKDKKHDLNAMLGKINRKTKLVQVCNPNNPTGTIVSAEEIKNFCIEASKKTAVFIDEAYIDFLPDRPTMASLVASNQNIIIGRTFSKVYGMAGLRFGYAIAHPQTIKKLDDMQQGGSITTSMTTIAAATAALDDQEFIKTVLEKNKAARDFTASQLEALNIPYIPSHTNFLYFSLAKYPSDFVKDMAKNNVMVRMFAENEEKWGRVSIGTMEEMQVFAEVLKKVWQS